MIGAYLVGAVLLGGGLVALDVLAGRVVRPSRRLPEASPADRGIPHEDVTISSNGLELKAWLLPGAPDASDPVVLLAHGWGASYGTVLELAEPLARTGRDVLLFDVRGHGRNATRPFVTIRDFRDDVTAAVGWVADNFPTRRVVVVGHSLGGSAAVLTAAERVALDGLVLIAAPASVLDVTADFLRSRGLPGRLLVTVLRPFWWRRIRGTFGPLTPTRRIAEVDVPILLIQPEHDRRVDRRHAERLSEAAGIGYHLIEGREHTDVLSAPETIELVETFLDDVTSGRHTPRTV